MKSVFASFAILFASSLTAVAFEPDHDAADPNFVKGLVAFFAAPDTEPVELAKHAEEKTSIEIPEVKAWPHDGSDLKPDAAATFGKLDNGLRYVILPTKAAPTKASLRLYMNTGSFMEDEDQRGMAHFLEHMAFNGTKNFPNGEAIEYFQRLGMSFGAHTNAMTIFDRTVYQLELPRANEELTSDGLKFFRDFLDGMLLDKAAIEKERGVILSEKLARNNAGFRDYVADVNFRVEGTLLPRRMPIGVAETIKKMPRDRFVDFYETWYTPGRAVVVATGDFDTAMVETLIKRHFETATAKRGEAADPDLGKVELLTAPVARLDTDTASEAVTVRISIVTPEQEEDDSAAHQRHELTKVLANVMLKNRLKKIVNGANAPVTDAGITSETVYHVAESHTAEATCRPEKWTAALELLEQEMRRALIHGFTDAELAEAKTQFNAIIQSMAAQADSRQPSELADEIVMSLVNNEVFAHPSEAVALGARQLTELTKEECLEVLRKSWSSGAPRIHLYGNLKLEGNAAEQILAAFAASMEKPVAAPVEDAVGAWAYTDFGPAGEIVHRADEADLNVIKATFANNVHLNIKPTKFQKNAVEVMVRFGGGQLEIPVDKPGLKLLANATFISGGLVACDLTSLNRAIADKNASVRFSVTEDAFQLGGTCLSNSLDTQLQLCAAYLSAAAFRQDAIDNIQQGIDNLYAGSERTLEGALGADGPVYSLLRGKDARFTLPKRDDLRKLSSEDLKAWLAKPLASGYLEVTIVGDVDPEKVLPLVAKTLGALPKRDGVKPCFAKSREVRFPTDLRSVDVKYNAVSDRAALVVAWPVATARDFSKARRVRALASVFHDRLRIKIREELGATYSPTATAYTTETFDKFGYFAAVLTLEPKHLTEIGKVVAELGDELTKRPITDDEFARAVQPVRAGVDQDMQENGFWLYGLADCQEHADALDTIRNRKADLNSITKAELEALAKEFMTIDKSLIIKVSGADKE